MRKNLWEGLQPQIVLAVLASFLLTSCIQEAKWTFTGEIPPDTEDTVQADGTGEVSPSDAPTPKDTEDTVDPQDSTEPEDTLDPDDTIDPEDTIDPMDTTDTVDADLCVPDCLDKECGDDGCEGTCGLCDDGNPCTNDACDEGSCSFTLKPLDALVVTECLCATDEDCEPLEDEDLCNGTLICDTEAETPTCAVDPDTVVGCNDLPDGAHPDCNKPVCIPESGLCSSAPDNEEQGCSDEDECTDGEVCTAGECGGGGAVSCDDSNDCTEDLCSSAAGCHQVDLQDGIECMDGDGVCVDGACCVPDCDQKDCGDDGCGGSCGECAGGTLCAGSWNCQDDLCVFTDPPDCDDGNDCTEDSCDDVEGCQHTALWGQPCDDGEFCSTGDNCKGEDGTVCEGDGWQECDDSNPCTSDQCIDGGFGCYNSANTEPCEDGNPCTVGDQCAEEACVPGGPEDCDDGNDCTEDSCSPPEGCGHVDLDGPACADDTGVCVEGACCFPACADKHCGDDGCGGTCGDCDDEDQCTEDTCVDGLCEFDPAPLNGFTCEDGDGCTIGDLCTDGVCSGDPAPEDQLEWLGCACDGDTDCTLVNDGAACNGDVTCVDGECMVGAAVPCDDGNVCTEDHCLGAAGCEFFPGNEGEPCEEGTGICVGGACCFPDCEGKACGDDGCGGSCGECGDLEECTDVAEGGLECTAAMVEIPAGDFWMGCNNCAGTAVSDIDCDPDEHTYHLVHLSNYQLDRTPVTVQQYAACVGAGMCTAPGADLPTCTWGEDGEEDHPANCLTWHQAGMYCAWAGKRLPTEAEWEKGARGGCEHNGGDALCQAHSRKYPWGDDPATCAHAAMSGCSEGTEEVCAHAAVGNSPYGLCDMAGNTWEWVSDPKLDDYYCDGDAATDDMNCASCVDWPGAPDPWADPQGPAGGTLRVRRGGSFLFDTTYLRASNRGAFNPDNGDDDLGFRCARSGCDPDCEGDWCGEDGCGVVFDFDTDLAADGAPGVADWLEDGAVLGPENLLRYRQKNAQSRMKVEGGKLVLERWSHTSGTGSFVTSAVHLPEQFSVTTTETYRSSSPTGTYSEIWLRVGNDEDGFPCLPGLCPDDSTVVLWVQLSNFDNAFKLAVVTKDGILKSWNGSTWVDLTASWQSLAMDSDTEIVINVTTTEDQLLTSIYADGVEVLDGAPFPLTDWGGTGQDVGFNWGCGAHWYSGGTLVVHLDSMTIK